MAGQRLRLLPAKRPLPTLLENKQTPRGAAVLRAAIYLLLLLPVFVTLYLRFLAPALDQNFHFRYLANGFLHGLLAADDLPGYYVDKIPINGHTYVPLGPFPAILLMPLVAFFGEGIDEYMVSLAFTLVNIWVLNHILLRLKIVDPARRRWLLALFFLGTLYFSILLQGNSWYLSHILTMSLLFLAVYESLGRKRYWLMGFWLGLAFLTRSTALFGLPYFLYLAWADRQAHTRQFALLALGLAPAGAFFLWYNYARFGNPFETGYALAVLYGPILDVPRSYGLFSLAHIPKNLYALFLAMPEPFPRWNAPILTPPYIQPSPWGMSIFITTPLFACALFARLEKRVIAAWLAVTAILIPLLTYYGIGYIQFGYRYATDFYPFLFIPTALELNRRFSRFTPLAIIGCILVNFWGAWVMLTGAFAFS